MTTFTSNFKLKEDLGFSSDGNANAMNNMKDIYDQTINNQIDAKLAKGEESEMIIPNLGTMSQWEKNWLTIFKATGDSNVATKVANQKADNQYSSAFLNADNNSVAGEKDLGSAYFQENPPDAKWYEAPTVGNFNSPVTELIKKIFGVDELTGSFEVGRAEQNDPHGDSAKLMALAQSGMLGGTGDGTGGGTSSPVLTPTEPQPSPNPEGLYIRPNMLNQVPDSYSQAFKDANQAYMQNVAFRPSDFNEKIDLRGFEQLKGLLDA